PGYLRQPVRLLAERKDLGLVRFYGATQLEQVSAEMFRDRRVFILSKREPTDAYQQPSYSDTPHLKSQAFLKRMGPYREGVPMEVSELEYEARFQMQDEFSAAFFPEYMDRTFIHIGELESFRTSSIRYRFEKRAAGVLAPLRGTRFHGLAKRAYR